VDVAADKHTQTAFEVYPIALEEAKKWNSEAALYQIPATRLMETNLGLPPGGPPGGWFFMFKVPDSPLEFYVEIVDGVIYGKTEAQPILIGEPKFSLLALKMDGSLMDSVGALGVYYDNGGKDYLSTHPNAILDYRLVHLDGLSNPVWSIFDVEANVAAPLVNIDAQSGKIVNDPYGQ